MLETKADVGPLYGDGDGDRIMMVDHLGNKVDGDPNPLSLLLVKLLRSGQLKRWRSGHINE